MISATFAYLISFPFGTSTKEMESVASILMSFDPGVQMTMQLIENDSGECFLWIGTYHDDHEFLPKLLTKMKNRIRRYFEWFPATTDVNSYANCHNFLFKNFKFNHFLPR